jgi:hypothetical protein
MSKRLPSPDAHSDPGDHSSQQHHVMSMSYLDGATLALLIALRITNPPQLNMCVSLACCCVVSICTSIPRCLPPPTSTVPTLGGPPTHSGDLNGPAVCAAGSCHVQ